MRRVKAVLDAAGVTWGQFIRDMGLMGAAIILGAALILATAPAGAGS